MTTVEEQTEKILKMIIGKIQQCKDNVNMCQANLKEARSALQIAQEICDMIERKYTQEKRKTPSPRPPGISGPPLKPEIIKEGGNPTPGYNE